MFSNRKLRPILGKYSAKVLPFYVPKSVVQPILDESVELVSGPGAERGSERLVVIMLGRQSNVREPSQSKGIDYQECIVQVPYLRLRDQVSPAFTTAMVLYLDKWAPIFLGWKWYGFPKKYACIRSSEENFTVSTSFLSGRKGVLSANYKAGNEPNKMDAPGFMSLASLQNKPFEGLRIINLQWLGAQTELKVLPIEAGLCFSKPLFPGWPTGELKVQALSKESLGGFQMETCWSLG